MLNTNPNFEGGGNSRRASTRSNLAETGELRRTSTMNPEQGQLRRTSTMNPEQGDLRRASMSLGLAPGTGEVARRVSNLNQIPENGVAENGETPGSVIPKRASTMSQSGGVRSIKIRKASVALHSMDECLPGSSRSEIKNRRESFSVITAGSLTTEENEAGTRRVSKRGSIFGNNRRESSMGSGMPKGLEMLVTPDVIQSIDEDENAKAKEKAVIIETKETLMEKQGRRDLLKLNLMFAFFSFITLSGICGIITIIYAIPANSPYQWLVILLTAFTIIGSWGTAFCQGWQPPAKTLDMERDERIQNLRNIFMAKEVNDYNKYNKQIIYDDEDDD